VSALQRKADEKSAIGLWIRLAKCYGLVLREVRHSQAESDVTLAQFDVLAQLLRHPDGMSAGQLSDALLVTAGNVTGLADRMSARGWVTRRADKDDQRKRIIRLTAAGRRVAQREVERHEALLTEMFAELGPRGQSELSNRLDRVRKAVEKSAASRAQETKETR